MDPNVTVIQNDIPMEVESSLGQHDSRLPENEITYPEYIEDEWDNISGDIILFI